MKGLRAVWERWGNHVLDLALLSGGYGLIRGSEAIIPYDASILEMNELDFSGWVSRHQIPEQVTTLVGEYDLVFMLLSGRYLLSVGLPPPKPARTIVLTDPDGLNLLPPAPHIFGILADGGPAARRWHVKAAHVRGFLFERLCRQIVHHGPLLLDWLRHEPQDTELLFYKQPRWRPQRSFW
jgi:hypothetical protein